MNDFGRSVVYPVAAGAVVVCWRLELWSLVIGSVAHVAVLARRNFEQRRRWLPAFLASRAITAVEERKRDPVPVELALLSKGRTATLERAAELVHGEADPYRWARAIERLLVAGDLVARGSVPGVSERPPASSRALAVWCGLGTVLLGGAVMTASRWWLIPLTAAFVALILQWTELREEQHWRPLCVATHARSRPSAQAAPVSDQAAAVELAVLAHGHLPLLLRASQLVAASKQPARTRARAEVRLRMAESLVVGSATATSSVWRRVWPCCSAGAVAALMWWVTA